MKRVFMLGALFSFGLFAEVTQIVNYSSEKFVMVVNEKQGKVIEEIITTLGESNLISLGFKQGHLNSLRKDLKGLPPLNFLAYIFDDPKLQKQMVSIRKSSVKWNRFVEGLSPGLNRDSESESFDKRIDGFALFLKVDSSPLKECANNKNWKGFVSHLVDKKQK